MEIEQHVKYSTERLESFSIQIGKIDELQRNNLCIYTTGSYGRLEASPNSDLDLFFIDSIPHNPTTNIDKTLINAEVIKMCRSMGLPEFSRDGSYLTIHNIDDILFNLGSPIDDFNNYFTARMLLLLESKPIYNEKLHEDCLQKIVERYYVDFHKHRQNFEAIFLANDIVRFWKTLCLNYEHSRHRWRIEEGGDSQNAKAVAHSKNLKLKFSRKLTCFSFIIQLAAYHEPVSQTVLVNMCKMTPLERLKAVKTTSPHVAEQIDSAISTYKWFLDRTQIPSADLLSWISDKAQRDEAFDLSRKFGDELFSILEEVDKKSFFVNY